MESILQDAITEGDHDLITRLYKIKPKHVFEALVSKLDQILSVYQDNNQGQVRAMVQIISWMNLCLFQSSPDHNNPSGSQLLNLNSSAFNIGGSIASLSSMGTTIGQSLSISVPDVIPFESNVATILFNCARKILVHSEEVIRIVFYLSMSNPQIITDHIIRINKEDPELNILQYCAFQLDKLVLVVRHIFTTFTQLKKPAQLSACTIIRKLIWNFIEWYPIDFVAISNGSRKLDDIIDGFFLLLNEDKKKFMPLQTMFMILNSNKISLPHYIQFIELLRKHKKEFSSCLVDILKAAVFLKDRSDLRSLAFDFETDVREIIQSGLKSKDQEESMLLDGLVGLYRLSPLTTVKIFSTMFDNKRLLSKVFYALANSDHQPWNTPISNNNAMCSFVKTLLHDSMLPDEDGGNNSSTIKKLPLFDKKRKEDPRKDVIYYTIKILEIEPKIAVIDDFDTIVRDIVMVLEEAPSITRSVTLSVLLKAYSPDLVVLWAKNSSLFVKAFSFILLSISKLIFESKKEEIVVLLEFLMNYFDHIINIMFQDASIMLSPTDTKLKGAAIHSIESALLYCIALTDIELFCAVKNIWIVLLQAFERLDKDEYDLLNIPHIAIYRKLLEPISYQSMFKALTISLYKPSLSTIVCFDQLYRRWKTLNMSRQQELMDSRLKRMSTKYSHSVLTHSEKETKSDWVSVTLSMCYLLPLCIPNESLEKQIYDSSTFLRFDTFFNTASERISIHLLVDAYLSDLVNLLRSENPILKEYLPHIIGEELDFSFWGLIEKKLQNQLNNTIQKDAEYLCRVVTIMHKALLKNENCMSMAMDKMLQFLSLDIDATHDQYTAEAKLAYCKLVYTLFERNADVFKDLVIRNFLAQMISSWISDMEYNTEQSSILKELDVTSIKCLKFLFYGLSLKPQNSDLNNTDLKEMKDRTFNNYVNVLQKVLYKTHVIQSNSSSVYSGKEIHYLTQDLIQSFASLVANNQDIGLKFIMNMAQNSSTKLRPFVLEILSFSLNATTVKVVEPQIISFRVLSKFLFEHDPMICVALYENIDVSVREIILEKIYYCFEEYHDVLKLLKQSVERDVTKTDAANVIFRRNSMSTKLLTLINQRYGLEYLNTVIQPIIDKISTDIKNGICYEIDPLKLQNSNELSNNTQHLMDICSSIITNIYHSEIPVMLKNTCYLISNIVNNKFPDAKLNAVSGYFFLRFICPAITSPENSGLTINNRTIESSRALVLIAKCIQNLANFVFFGNKEEWMIPMNSFIHSHKEKTIAFLENLCTWTAVTVTTTTVECTESDLQDIYLHLFQQKDKILNQLTLKSRYLQQQNELLDHDSGQQALKKIKDQIDQLVLELGQPKVRLHMATSNTPNNLTMNPSVEQSIDLIKLKNMGFLTEGPRTKERTPGVIFIARRLVNISMDHAINYLIMLLSQICNDKYYILIDFTGSAWNEINPTLLDKLLSAMNSSTITTNLSVIHVLNPNNNTRLALKQANKTLMELAKRCLFYSAISQLLLIFPSNSLTLPSLTLSLDEPTVLFTVIRNVQSSAYPVHLLIGKNCIQIQSTKKIELIGSIPAVLNDVIDVLDVSELIKRKESANDTRFVIKTSVEDYDLTCTNFSQICEVIQQCKHKRNQTKKDNIDESLVNSIEGDAHLLVLIFANLLQENTALQKSAYQLYNALLIKLNLPLVKPLFINGAFMNDVFMNNICNIDTNTLALFIIDLQVQQHKDLNLNFLEIIKAVVCKIMKNINELSSGLLNSLVGSLINMTSEHYEHIGLLINNIWVPVSTYAGATAMVVECMLSNSYISSSNSIQTSIMCSIFCALGLNKSLVNTCTGKLLLVIRKSLNHVDNNINVDLYLQILANYAFHDTLDIDHYLADLMYLTTSLAGQGTIQQRTHLYYITCNILANITTTIDEQLLNYMNDQIQNPFVLNLFGLEYLSLINNTDATVNTTSLVNVGHLVHFVADVMICSSPNIEQLHAHRSRLMGLISSSAFQYNKILQPRAFVALGALSSDDADDDLIYQILMVLKYSLTHFEPDDSDLACSTIICLTNIMHGNLYQSDFTRKIIWIAIYLLLLGHKKLYIYSLNLLEASLNSLDQNGYFLEKGLIESLLQVKQSFDESSRSMDKQTGLNFELDFGFALSSALAKGLSDKDTKGPTETVIVSLLNLCDVNTNKNKSELVGLVLLMICSEQYDVGEIVLELNKNDASIFEVMHCESDTSILFIMTMALNFLYLDIPEQTLQQLFAILYEGVQLRPDIFAAISPKLIVRLRQLAKNTFNDGFKQNITNLYIKAVEVLGKYNIQLSVLLEETGFQSLAEPLLFDTNKNRQRQLAMHVDSLISSIINDEE